VHVPVRYCGKALCAADRGIEVVAAVVRADCREQFIDC